MGKDKKVMGDKPDIGSGGDSNGERCNSNNNTPSTSAEGTSKTPAMEKMFTAILDKMNKMDERVDYLYSSTGVDNEYEPYDTELVDENQYYDYDYNNNEGYETAYYDEGQPVSKKPKMELDNIHNPLLKSMKQALIQSEETSPPIDEIHANILNRLFTNGLEDNKFRDLCKQIVRPENCDKITTVKINNQIWAKLYPNTQKQDTTFQTVDTAITKGSAAIAQISNYFLQNSTNENLDDGLKTKFQELFEVASNSLGLLGHAHYQLCMRRRELIKTDLTNEFKSQLCSTNVPVTTLLFGDDVENRIKDISKTNFVTNKLSQKSRGAFRGNRGGRGNFQNYSRRGAYRRPYNNRGGRGFYGNSSFSRGHRGNSRPPNQK